jgi:hypothetical protein
MFLIPHHVGYFCNNVIKAVVVQQCGSSLALGHSCTHVAIIVVESQGVAKARERCHMGQSAWSSNCWIPGPSEASILGYRLNSGSSA